MAKAPRRIVFVSGYFPPLAPIGAVRAGKLAEHWTKDGHDVRAIAIELKRGTAGPAHTSRSIYYLPYDPPGKRITQIKASFERTFFRRRSSGEALGSEQESTIKRRTAAAAKAEIEKIGLLDVYRQFLQFPDSYKMWIAPAIDMVLSWQGSWKPDLIYSSGPPHSGQVIASRLAARLNVPWIAECRDLWAGDPYFDRHPFIESLHARLAKKTLSKAAACVVVTKSASDYLRTVTHRPVLVSYNGFDPEDFAGMDEVAPFDPDRLTIVHAGVIYQGRRDPSALFEAIASLGEDKNKVRCLFYHDEHGCVETLAERYGVQSAVEILDAIPRAQILRVERQADILLECRWQDSAADGVIPGKLFEYIGARRPILSIGSLTAESANIIRDNSLGLVSNDPQEIKTMLTDALAVKTRLGRLPDLMATNYDRFRRSIQFQKIDELIDTVLLARKAA